MNETLNCDYDISNSEKDIRKKGVLSLIARSGVDSAPLNKGEEKECVKVK